jgi:protein tyrosine phosphatase (PTP) superfamily phosphohydrolase (DUF442 family)
MTAINPNYLRFCMMVFALALGCTPPPAQEPRAPHRLQTEHLPNAVYVSQKVISGGLPEGDAAFAELKRLGVKTVISVDGAQPDLESARQHGLRYVHLPHGYDGIPTPRIQELAKAVRDLPGPIYIHCHHGKHRSPAAASVACVAAGTLSPEQAVPVLQMAGTSAHYRGLYRAAEKVRPFEEELLDALDVEFHESVEIPPMAEAMVAIEETHDHLRWFAAAQWQALADHPDLDAAHEALMLREHFTELLRTDDVASEPEAFREILSESEAAAQELEDALRQWQESGDGTVPPALFEAAMSRVSRACTTCHEQFRDVPLDEK